ncbi:MAG: tripartite tricarboxylate transporter TctB family protein [Geminicoccaceae bacterium]
MSQQRRTTKPAPPWLFVTLVVGFAAYYAHDVWGGRFETIAYGILCIFLLGTLGLLLIMSAIRQEQRPGGHVEELSGYADGVPRNTRPFLLALLLTGYAALQATAGFPAATVMAFGCLVWFFGERRWPRLFAIVIGMTFLTHVTFVELLSIPVPTGAFVD